MSASRPPDKYYHIHISSSGDMETGCWKWATSTPASGVAGFAFSWSCSFSVPVSPFHFCRSFPISPLMFVDLSTSTRNGFNGLGCLCLYSFLLLPLCVRCFIFEHLPRFHPAPLLLYPGPIFFLSWPILLSPSPFLPSTLLDAGLRWFAGRQGEEANVHSHFTFILPLQPFSPPLPLSERSGEYQRRR